MFTRIVLTIAMTFAIPIEAMSAIGVGGTNATVYSNSTKEVDTYHNTAVSQRIDSFALELVGGLQGGPVLYDQSFNASLGDPIVQAALITLQGILSAAGASSFSGPKILSSTTDLTGSSSQVLETSRNTLVTTVVTTYVGPQTILIGENQGTSFTLSPGQMDIDILARSDVDIFTTTTTTDAFLTRAVYEFTGIVPSNPGTVPLPGSLGLLLIGILGLGLSGHRLAQTPLIRL